MIIHNLQINNFRNLEPVCLEFGSSINLFLGNNGQGKTNILEAIYLSCSGQSFRPGKSENFVNFRDSQKSAKIKANLSVDTLDYKVEMTLSKNDKSLLLNGKRTNPTKLLRNFGIVLFSPESLTAIKGGPEQRRALVDDLLIAHDVENLKLVGNFKKCLKNRNRILKDYKTARISRKECLSLMDSYNEIYLPQATELCLARLRVLKNLTPFLIETMGFISHCKNVDVSVDYLISGESAIEFDQEMVRCSLEKRLSELGSYEMEIGISLVGPHRHDIRFLFDKNDSRYYCSQGQQRALILSFKMVQIMYHYEFYQRGIYFATG